MTIVSRCQDIQIYCSHSINLCLQYSVNTFHTYSFIFILCIWCLGYSQYLHLLALFSRNFRYLYSSLSSSSMTRSSFLGFGTPMVLVASLNKENHWAISITVTINTSHIYLHRSSKEKLQQNYNIRQHYYHTLVKIYGQQWYHFHIRSQTASFIIEGFFFIQEKYSVFIIYLYLKWYLDSFFHYIRKNVTSTIFCTRNIIIKKSSM